MAVPKIGYQDGINATEANLKKLDPAHQAGYDKFADTLRTLKAGHNEALDRLAAVEAQLLNIPFPFRGYSTPPGA